MPGRWLNPKNYQYPSELTAPVAFGHGKSSQLTHQAERTRMQKDLLSP